MTLPYAQPAVRDLAFLLCAPPPLHFGPPCPRARLLGGQGLAYLAELDRDPAALLSCLAASPRLRLGHYAEQLLLFWFHLLPHIEVVAHGLALRDPAGLTLGEFDFLLRVDGEPWHLETASKFYLQAPQAGGVWIGPGLNDAWPLKAYKLTQQLALSGHACAQGRLPADFATCRHELLLAGWFFYPPDCMPQDTGLTRGWCAPLDEAWPRTHGATRWVHLARERWLAPARVQEEDTQAEADLRRLLQVAQAPQLLAELEQGRGGVWIEVARGFVMPQAWPDLARLDALLARI
ncbi:DUF1853 family protein [Craterilacuibacter sp. RT1T]|uniref:DUF1853 family protein n=1 Tax=Craterilacuibacter sp. RT1T TaxID=2942211 RepID=UPI0020BF1F01|nr:DUF1853 family protein [Craterilacuibacter sp. RT1T]MCL6261907.1 DUF1853 family protein [Craterilacuibacter sp. RT1T]